MMTGDHLEMLEKHETQIHGDKESGVVGLRALAKDHEKLFWGDGRSLGVIHKINFMWRAHVGLLCAISAALSSVVTVWVMKLLH